MRPAKLPHYCASDYSLLSIAALPDAAYTILTHYINGSHFSKPQNLIKAKITVLHFQSPIHQVWSVLWETASQTTPGASQLRTIYRSSKSEAPFTCQL